MKQQERELRQRLHEEFMQLIDEANRREDKLYHMYRKPAWKHESRIMTVICFIAWHIGGIIGRIRTFFTAGS